MFHFHPHSCFKRTYVNYFPAARFYLFTALGRHGSSLDGEEKEKEEGRMKKSDEASRAGERKKQKERERKREKGRTVQMLGLET